MITLLNGQNKTRPYEDLFQNINWLIEKTIIYQNHLNVLSGDTYRKYAALKEDLDNKLINKDQFLQFLQPLKIFFDKMPAYENAELNKQEIIDEIKKHF